jgi:hypothetical protein
VERIYCVVQKKALSDDRAFNALSCTANLGRSYIVGTRAFFALTDFEVYLLVFIQGGIAACFNFRVMDEQISAAVIGSNETKTLTCIEPLYFTCTH